MNRMWQSYRQNKIFENEPFILDLMIKEKTYLTIDLKVQINSGQSYKLFSIYTRSL